MGYNHVGLAAQMVLKIASIPTIIAVVLLVRVPPPLTRSLNSTGMSVRSDHSQNTLHYHHHHHHHQNNNNNNNINNNHPIHSISSEVSQ